MFARVLVGVFGLGVASWMSPSPEGAATEALVVTNAVVSSPTAPAPTKTATTKTTTYVGWYSRWGHEESCYGYPDLMDVWLVDDQSNEYRVGETAHNECLGYHNGTFAYSQRWIDCQNQSGGCEMITGTVLSHVHHYQDWCYGEELFRTGPMALIERALAGVRLARDGVAYDLATILRR